MEQKYDQEISIGELISIILKRKKIILISFLLFTFLASFYTFAPIFNKAKMYEAESSISIVYDYKAPENPENIGEGYVYYQDRLQNIMIPTINGYAQSLSILRSIITELDIKDSKGRYIDAKILSDNIEIENQTGSNLIKIKVLYNDENLASDIANKIPQKLIQMANANEELNNYQINIIDYAIATEDNKSTKLIPIIIGMSSGITVGIFVAFFVVFFNKFIQSKFQISVMGFDIDLILKSPLDSDSLYKILSIAMLSDSKSAVIGDSELLSPDLTLNLLNLMKDNNIKTEIKSLKDKDFFLKSKEADKTLILVKEGSSRIDNLQQFSKVANKYNINTSVIYIEN